MISLIVEIYNNLLNWLQIITTSVIIKQIQSVELVSETFI